eukprot:TRINITY_DN10209_c0_g1_i1.p1 TRINITY_DN10209_c0_g1~~TRINITY_DN10209_c0_g1_i1.p1  ORF type:complete len:1124 (-),score=372.79 TRINITY_DN10209_c0_g1_i1:391-3762(-)
MRKIYLDIFIFFKVSILVANSESIENEPIAKHEDCKKDIQVLQNLCEIRDEDLTNNWAVLDCIDSMPPEKQISQECDNHVWKFKLEVTRQDVFLDQAKEICGDDIKVCKEEENSEPGHLLACLVEKKHETKSLQCGKFLGQVENIIFSDYRIISNFMNACDKDITTLKCGKTRKDIESHHSQGGTIQCLSENMENVEPSCKKEILTIAELQADDYHLDRALYLACKQDREEVCPRVQPGDGRVYKCLMKNKMSVSPTCQEQLVRRQKIISQDFKADGGLVKACKEEIKHYSCRKGVDKNEKQTVKLAQILLCLEDKIRNEQEVSGMCINEMREIRRELMEDYSISPELVANCATEIEHFCSDTKTQKHGKTIHCLMKAAMDQSQEKLSVNTDKNTFGKKCLNAVDQLVQETQVISDWKADPVLEDACEEVVTAACDPKLGSDAVMSCLMEQLSKESDHMTTQCSEVLMQVHYFLAREVMIDEHLYKACNKDAIRVCNGAVGWHKTDEDPRNQLVFPCLVRNLYSEDDDDEDGEDEKNAYVDNTTKLSDDCTHEVERTLRQRAMSVQLHPEIEEECRNFLHSFCTTNVKPGEELQCLQENLNNLDGACKKTVSKYTRIESRNPYLHPIISKACSNLIERKCGLESKAQDGSGVMECLMRHKMEHPLGSKGAMNTKCRTVVEHWQILTLQDWRFSFKFKEACKDDIREHCTDPRPKKKQDVIGCLVLFVANDTVEESKHRIKKACRAELKFELLQKHSNVKLDPVLDGACGADIEKYCANEKGDDGGLECLKSLKHRELSKMCRKELFKEEVEEAVDNDTDFALMRGCKREIKEHCADEDAKDVLRCLKDFRDDSNFDAKCLNIIGKRIVQHSKDYRLNPSLQKSCHKDIPKFCKDALKFKGEDFFEGHVIACLKHKAIQKNSMLTDQCRKEIMTILSDSAHIVDADPELEENCPNSLAHCRNKPNIDTDLKINECLKDMFERKALIDGEECNKHLAQVIEGTGADIHADPVLHTACAVDLRKFCRDIPTGEGRMFACLVSASRVENYSLEPDCKTVLTKRMEMYDLAVKVAPLDSVQELYQSVMKSPHRNYMLSTGMMFLGAIFVFGLCFGRVTKRLNSEIKNR